MSVVVAVARNGEVAVASDGRATTSNGSIVSDQTFKMVSVAGGLFKVGGVGDLSRLQDVMEAVSKAPSMQVIVDTVGEMPDDTSLSLIVCGMDGKRTVIKSLDSNGAMLDHKRFFACGTGSDVALGALEVLYRDKERTAAQIAKEAVKVAIKYNNSCGGSIRVI